jgi:hypothetical protein
VVNNRAYLVDCGPGVVRRSAAAEKNGIPALKARELNIVFITHLHSDHTLGYPDLVFSPWVLGRRAPFEAHDPQGLKAMTEHVEAAVPGRGGSSERRPRCLIAGVPLTAAAETPFMRRPGEVRLLPCSDHLKEIVYRCIGERRKRYESADELIEALCNPPAALRVGTLRTLKGVHLAFTGILTRRRQEAVLAARRAGAIVHGMPSARTTVVVRGRPNPLQAAGRDAGLKLMEIKRLRDKDHRITLLDEARFWRLVGVAPAGNT